MISKASRRIAIETLARDCIIENLIAQRTIKGITQTEVARRMGIKQPVISELENEHVDPRLSTLQRYAKALGGHIEMTFINNSDDHWE